MVLEQWTQNALEQSFSPEAQSHLKSFWNILMSGSYTYRFEKHSVAWYWDRTILTLEFWVHTYNITTVIKYYFASKREAQSGSKKEGQPSPSRLTFLDWASCHFHALPWAAQRSQQVTRYLCWAEGVRAEPGTGMGSAWRPERSAAVLAAAGADWPWKEKAGSGRQFSWGWAPHNRAQHLKRLLQTRWHKTKALLSSSAWFSICLCE